MSTDGSKTADGTAREEFTMTGGLIRKRRFNNRLIDAIVQAITGGLTAAILHAVHLI